MWLELAIAVIIQVIAYVITPKPKAPKPPEVRDLEDPTAEAGRPIPVIWGEVTVKGINVLWFGDKHLRKYKVDA